MTMQQPLNSPSFVLVMGALRDGRGSISVFESVVFDRAAECVAPRHIHQQVMVGSRSICARSGEANPAQTDFDETPRSCKNQKI